MKPYAINETEQSRVLALALKFLSTDNMVVESLYILDAEYDFSTYHGTKKHYEKHLFILSDEAYLELCFTHGELTIVSIERD